MGRTTAEIPAFKGRVLVVDDIREDVDFVGHLLHDLGYQVTPVEEPDAVLELAQEMSPRLIVLSADVRRGFNLCHGLKKDAVLRRIPLVLVTAKASAETIRKHRMLPTRADAYVAKPIDPERFREAVREVLPEDFLAQCRETGVENAGNPPGPGALEVAVVTYVEDEVRSLRDQVTRLQNEKRELGETLADLERRMRENADRFESGLQDILARQADVASASSRIAELEAEEARNAEEIRRLSEEKARLAEETKKLAAENARLAEEIQRLASENGRLAEDCHRLGDENARLVEQNRTLTRDIEASRAESHEMTALFERLEAGYKESIATLEAEKNEIEFMLGRTEASMTALQEDSAQLDLARREIVRLQEAAARTDVLEEELAKLRAEASALAERAARVEEMEAVVEALKQDVEAAKAREADLADARAETESLRRLLNAIRSLLNGGT